MQNSNNGMFLLVMCMHADIVIVCTHNIDFNLCIPLFQVE